MKSKTWALILAGIFLFFLILSGILLRPTEKKYAEVWSDGALLYTLDLSQDRVLTVKTQRGENELTVRDGKIAVTGADCPDHHCMARGFQSGGPQIVCLPHRLVIRFADRGAVDGVSG